MAIHTLDQNLTPVAATASPITAATVTSAAIDTQGYRRALVLVEASPTGTGTTVNVKVQECATSTGSPVAFADVVGTDTSVTNHVMADGSLATGWATTVLAAGGLMTLMIHIDLSKRMRWLKVLVTGAGASAAGTECSQVLLYEPQNLGTPTGATSIHV